MSKNDEEQAPPPDQEPDKPSEEKPDQEKEEREGYNPIPDDDTEPDEDE